MPSLRGRLRLLMLSSVRESLSLELSILMPYKSSEMSTAKVQSKHHSFFFFILVPSLPVCCVCSIG